FAISKERLDRAKSALDGRPFCCLHQFSKIAPDMIRRDTRDVDFIDSFAQYRRALEQETSEREQVAAIVRHRIVRRARRFSQRRGKRLDLHLHHLARTHLSGYAISGDSAEKACISKPLAFQSRGAPCRTKNSPLPDELLELRPKNRDCNWRSCRFSRRVPWMRPRDALVQQLRILRSGLQQQLPRDDLGAGGGQGTIQLLRIFYPGRRRR